MNAYNPPASGSLDRRAALDAEDDALWERQASGEHDRDRLAGSKRATEIVNALPMRFDPTPEQIEEARRKADEAMRRLIAPFLSDDELKLVGKGHRQYRRSGL